MPTNETHGHLWHILSRLVGDTSGSWQLPADSVEFHLDLGKIAPRFYGLGLIIGVTFMGLMVPDFTMKVWLAMLWFAATPLYFYCSMKEIIAHIQKYGYLTIDEVSRQSGDPWIIWIAVLVTVFIWVVGVAIGHGPTFTIVEAVMLIVAFMTALVEKLTVLKLMFAYQAAVAAQKRFEEVKHA